MSLGRGYDRGYRACSNFWGKNPAKNVKLACSTLGYNGRCLDLGCGEGKNASYAAQLGLTVTAVDASEAALINGQKLFGRLKNIQWILKEAIEFLENNVTAYDLIVTTGMLHCLETERQALRVLDLSAEHLRSGGLLVLSSFNDRRQDLTGHEPEFNPLLLSHACLLNLVTMASFEIVTVSDEDLSDLHPHIGVPHIHSITRIIARRP